MEKLSDSGPAAGEVLAQWASAVTLAALPPEVIQAAKRSIVDTVGVVLASGPGDLAGQMRRHAQAAYGGDQATVIGRPGRLSPLGAALVNGTAAHALDFDDTSYTGILHGSAVAFPAALAATEAAGGGGRRLLEAFIAGVEVTYATALFCTTHHYFKGWWSSGSFGIIGAAAAASRALELDSRQTTRAIGLAGVQAAGLKAGFGTDAKPYLAGRAAAAGVECALLAAAGVTGPAEVFEDHRGFVALMNDGVSDPASLSALGRTWRLLEPGIFIKRFPICSAAHAAAELAERFLRDHDLSLEDVASVEYEVPPLVAISLVYDRPATPRQAQFSLPFAVGCMLVFGDIRLARITQETLEDPRLQAAMTKVTYQLSETMATPGGDAPEGARVCLHTCDGRQFEDFLAEPKGMPGNALSDDEIAAKFHDCAAFGGVSREKSDGLINLLWHLEQQDSVTSLLAG